MVIKLQDEQRKATTTVVANGVIEAMAVFEDVVEAASLASDDDANDNEERR